MSIFDRIFVFAVLLGLHWQARGFCLPDQNNASDHRDGAVLSPTIAFEPNQACGTQNAVATNACAPSGSPASLDGYSRYLPTALPSDTTARDEDPAALRDINVIHTRRLPFIVSSATSSQLSSIPTWLSTLDTNGKWPDSEINYDAGCSARRANWPAQVHWQRIVVFAAAYHGGVANGSDYVKSLDLRAAITRAMDFWFSNDFSNPACLDSGGLPSCPCNTPGFWNPNWFSNIILIPGLTSQSCLLLNDTLTSTQLANCSNIVNRAYGAFDRHINGLGTLTGANTLDVARIGIDLGLLTVNVSLVTDAFRRVHKEVSIQTATKADGIRPDGSFGQHGGIIYNGNYGKDYTNDVLAIEIEASGTQFEADVSSKEAFVRLVDGDRWMIYQNVHTSVLHWDLSVLGRFISFPVVDNQATSGLKINLTQVLELGEAWRSGVLTDFYHDLTRHSANVNAGQLNGNRMFFSNDYMVQRGRGYLTSLRMYSNRTQNTECVNSQNPLGFHLSDGTVYTYMQGNEYEDIAAAWDWNLIPGTTVDYGATPLTCGTTQWTGIEAYVGGASDARVGVSAMRYTNPLTGALSWQKAWFFLEADVHHVMINSIASQTDAPVFSILDQRRHVSEVLIDGVPQGSGNYSAVSTLWHGNIGYRFPDGQSGSFLSVALGNRSGDWSSIGISTQPPPTIDIFAAWLYHGNPSASTAYTTYPATDYDSFLRKLRHTAVAEIRNDVNVSAIYDEVHHTAAVVVWQASGGTVTVPLPDPYAPITIDINRGMIVILCLRKMEITVADPAQTSNDALVLLSLGYGKKLRRWGQGRSRLIEFALPRGDSAGASVTKSFL